jgi:hypothetical protein
MQNPGGDAGVFLFIRFSYASSAPTTQVLQSMTKTRWIIVFLIAPVLIFLALFGFCGPEGKSAAIATLKAYLAFLAIAFVVVAIGMGFN